jgi:hypothetical protein
MRTSIYADDTVIFIAPVHEEVDQFAQILQRFGEVTGLVTNLDKSSVVPIRCDDIDLPHVLHSFPAVIKSFPVRYLGLPLTVYRLKRSDLQHLEDKFAAKMVPWEGRNITVAGRTALVKSVLSSLAIFHLTPLNIPPGLMARLRSILRAFLWAGTDKTSGGKCKVNWKKVCRPLSLGGLGVLDLDKFATALRLRWPWLEWKDPTKAWVGLGNPCSEEDMDLFYAAIEVTIGDGRKASFWHAPWLSGLKPKDIAPSIFSISKRKKCLIREAMQDAKWISRIPRYDCCTPMGLSQAFGFWAVRSS